MMMTATYEIGLDTPIGMLTPRQLFEMQREWFGDDGREKDSDTPSRWIVNSVEELAEILGTSSSTVYRMKRQGLLNEAISQYGKWMCIDVNKVIDLFRLSNHKNKRKGSLR